MAEAGGPSEGRSKIERLRGGEPRRGGGGSSPRRRGRMNSDPNPTAHLAGSGEVSFVAKSTTRRHRADLPVSTPLTGVTETLTSALNVPVGAAGKGGLVVVVSSGLVAGGVALPADATVGSARDAGTASASIPLLASADQAVETATATQTVTAASGAKVAFEHEAFRPVAKHAAATSSPA